MDKIKELFLHSSAEYRTAPLWVWNGDMTEEEIEKTLKELKTHGFGGAFVHPRPGMKISYLDHKFFSAWKIALDTAKNLGLKLNIYDENSYPSGFGGGHVSSELPGCLSESMRYEIFPENEMDFSEEKESWLGDHTLVAAYACEKGNGKLVLKKELTEIPRHKWKGEGRYYAVIRHLPSQTAGWLAGFADIDRLRPEVTEKFLEKVYDAYAGYFQEDFGEAIPAIFTDEPSLPGSTVYGNGGEGTLPINHWFAYEFQKRKGYSILKNLPCLFDDWEGFENEKIRHDYYEVTLELWTENFLEPVHKWCQEHHIAYTGHFMEDGWPKPYYIVVSPAVMSYYEYQDWPGIDLLQAFRLKEEASEAQQITMLELMSAAHQFGKERVFCEAFGAGGYDSGLEDYKRIGDYLFANGINYINEHLSYTSYIGARKRDHPQSFDWRQPWWDDFTLLNDYFGRLSAVLSQGKSRERILVLNPSMTGFIFPRTQDSSQLVDNILAKEPDMRPFLSMIQDLRRQQWDINLGDEIILKRHAKAADGKLNVVEQNYEVVILHSCIKNMLPSTISLLKEYLHQGGKVLSIGKPGCFISGTSQPGIYEELFSHENFIIFRYTEELYHFLQEHYRKDFFAETELPEGVESIRRELPDGRELYFITNHSKTDVTTNVTLNGSYLEKWNPWNGSTCFVKTSIEGNKIHFTMNLKDGQSKLYCVYHDSYIPMEKPLHKTQAMHQPKEVSVVKITPQDKNVWPLVYCDLYIDGESYKNCSAVWACSKIFKSRGFQADPWDNQVQFKEQTYGRNRFYPENSGFSAVYHFSIARGFLPEELLLAAEYGDRYSITVNGFPTAKEKKEYFLDRLVRQYDITPFIREGENEIILTAPKFDVELELEAVTLRGNFGIFSRNGKWEMDAAPALKLGNWISQGYPFYYGAMLYDFSFQGKTDQKTLLSIPHTDATSTSVKINGHYAGIANIDGKKPIDISTYIKNGKNNVQARVCGSMKNFLGPHFDPEMPRKKAWPDMWRKAPVFCSPRPEEYDLIPYGLDKMASVFSEAEE